MCWFWLLTIDVLTFLNWTLLLFIQELALHIYTYNGYSLIDLWLQLYSPTKVVGNDFGAINKDFLSCLVYNIRQTKQDSPN